MTSVRVGANTLASQAARRRNAGGFVKVGAQTLDSKAAARRGAGYKAPPGPGAQYVPSPAVIPANFYNPSLDIELAAGKRGAANTIEDLLTKNTRGEQNLALDQSEVARQEDEQRQARDRTLATIAQSYQRLGARQNETANQAGVINGGALLQAAVKRKANELKSDEPVNQRFGEQQAADQRSLARLALTRQQEGEDIGTQTSRAEREQTQFGVDTQNVKAREAAANGYVDPGGVVARTSVQRGAGFVRVGMPQRPQRAGRGF